mmetsp:Transcript_15999/g.23421  ORF Transcript_15999/g.23421 Transcript_15999/m.23421 type:complete len:167 (+) Transcript_15999:197-697(+)
MKPWVCQDRRLRFSFYSFVLLPLSLTKESSKEREHYSPSWEKPLKTYDKKAVMETQSLFYPSDANYLMLFDGNSRKITTFSDPKVASRDIHGIHRAITASFLMAQALYSNFPGRSHPGAPPFQILFSATLVVLQRLHWEMKNFIVTCLKIYCLHCLSNKIYLRGKI